MKAIWGFLAQFLELYCESEIILKYEINDNFFLNLLTSIIPSPNGFTGEVCSWTNSSLTDMLLSVG